MELLSNKMFICVNCGYQYYKSLYEYKKYINLNKDITRLHKHCKEYIINNIEKYGSELLYKNIENKYYFRLCLNCENNDITYNLNYKINFKELKYVLMRNLIKDVNYPHIDIPVPIILNSWDIDILNINRIYCKDILLLNEELLKKI